MEAQAAVVPATGVEDVRRAIGNALKLSGSLAASWTIALAVRLVLPRGLGPDRFGALSSADALTTTAFVFLQLGVDTYVRTAVAVRPDHAREFFGGVFLLRGALAVALSAAMIVVSRATGRSPEV
ncbi:MAG: flippase, partial [Myxococcales bacterium]